MLRTLDSSIVSYLNINRLKIIQLIDVEFPDGWVYLTNAARNIDWNGNTYSYTYNLNIGDVTQSFSLQNDELEVSLSGIPLSFKSTVLNETKQITGNYFHLYQAFMDIDTDVIIDEPVLLQKGIINGMRFSDNFDNKTSTITLPIASIFARFNEKNGMLTNPSTHNILFPNDKIFTQVPELVSKNIEFGKL